VKYLILIVLAMVAGVNFPEAYKEAQSYVNAAPKDKAEYLIQKMQ
jgi:hypothetical protein